ncbi:MAG: FecR domain-containing protein [Patescibacteria group bacterium]
MDFLAAIAEAFLNLPKVLPQISCRKKIRENFESYRFPSFFGILRQTTAFAMLVIVVGGIALTSFISQTRTAVAQLSVESGVVKIREAKSAFFTEVEKSATIRLGDTIRVGIDSTAELAFYDASKLFLTAETEVSITAFDPDFISRENSGVTVALLSGSLDAEVAKENSSFEVETSTGSVEAQNAKFSVSVNSATGSTKIQTSEDVVAVKSSKNSEAVALVAGESVVFEEEEILFAEAEDKDEKAVELPLLKELQTDLEFAKIRSFDALIASQNGDDSIARKIRASVKDSLDSMLLESGISKVEGGEVEALGIFIRKNYLDGPTRELALKNLDQISATSEILNYYLVAPQKLRGIPAFEILARERYVPTGRLRNLFAALLAGELAHAEIKPLVKKLAENLTVEIAKNLSGRDSEKSVSELLAGLQDQPIFLPVLEKLEPIVPSATRSLVSDKIDRLEERVREYAGG